MRTLKDLTQEECIKIASIANPDVEWKFVQSSSKWDGFDLVEKDCDNENIAKYIFQIDYRSIEELKSEPYYIEAKERYEEEKWDAVMKDRIKKNFNETFC